MTEARAGDSPELQILKAVQQLDQKLSTALNKQTAQLTESIQKLADRHADSLLQQERRNNTFADRTRVESVAEHGHDTAGHVQNLILRVANIEKRLVELAAEISSCQQSMSDRAVSFLAGTNGYLITFIIMLVVAVAAAALARLLR